MSKRWLQVLLATMLIVAHLCGCNKSVGNQGTGPGGGGGDAAVTPASSPTATPPPNVTLQRIQVTSDELTLAVGFSVQLTATGVYSDNSTQDLTSKVTWKSSSSQTATVSTSGLATGVKAGAVTFTATLGSVSGSTNLTITSATLTGIEVRPASPTVAVGTQQQMQAIGHFSDESDIDVTNQASWAVSSTIASIRSNGLLTATTAGSATISATIGAIKGTTPLTVSSAALVSIAVTPADATVAVGGQQSLTATGTFADGSTQVITSTVTWSSAKTSVATVSAAGVVTGVAGGTTQVTASLRGISGAANITVASLQSIQVTPANSTVAVQATLAYTAIGTFSNGATQNLTKDAAWSSSDPTIASINDVNGVATGIKDGKVTISAQVAGITGSTPLTVAGARVVPTPAPDDPKYFQILIDDRVNGGTTPHVMHFSFVAGTLKLNAPAKQNSTWLTGGGPNHDDFTKPVMQIASTATGNANANFAQTYDFTSDKLPLDPSGRYRVIKIPFLDPNDATQSNAGSGRLYITLDAAAVMQVNAGGPGGFSISQPSPAAGGAGSNNRFDFVEINCATPAAGTKNIAFVNTTNVDFFSLGILINGRQPNGQLATFGLDLSGAQPVTSTIQALQALPGSFSKGTVTVNGKFMRFLAPDLSFNGTETDLDQAITDGYAFYAAGNTLSFTVAGVQYTATATGNNLNFTAPQAFTIAKPSTLNVIAATGPLDVAGQPAAIQNGQKFVAAYLNRGVFEDTSVWNTQSAFYPAGTESNAYSSLLHVRFLNGAVYGFSFDDVPSGGVLTAPAIDQCTSMTLVVDNE